MQKSRVGTAVIINNLQTEQPATGYDVDAMVNKIFFYMNPLMC